MWPGEAIRWKLLIFICGFGQLAFLVRAERMGLRRDDFLIWGLKSSGGAVWLESLEGTV